MVEIFQCDVLIFKVVNWNITFRPLHPPAYLKYPCLSGHRNDSTRETILKVWLLIKQGIKKLWKFYSINDLIIFHAYQSKKRHKKFLKKRYKINSKRKIQLYQLFLLFFLK